MDKGATVFSLHGAEIPAEQLICTLFIFLGELFYSYAYFVDTLDQICLHKIITNFIYIKENNIWPQTDLHIDFLQHKSPSYTR